MCSDYTIYTKLHYLCDDDIVINNKIYKLFILSASEIDNKGFGVKMNVIYSNEVLKNKDHKDLRDFILFYSDNKDEIVREINTKIKKLESELNNVLVNYVFRISDIEIKPSASIDIDHYNEFDMGYIYQCIQADFVLSFEDITKYGPGNRIP